MSRVGNHSAAGKIMRGKVRYEIDPHNRLVIAESGKKTGIRRFRQVLTGYFKTGRNNSLSYHIKAPRPRGARIPHQVKLSGKWSLTTSHNLRFTLNKWGRQTLGDKLTLQGEILDAGKNSLLFAVVTRTKQGASSLYTLKLAGAWQADKHNRLTFRVKRGRGRYDILVFRGAWEINRQRQIVYRYEKTGPGAKKAIRVISFKGHWDIGGAKRVSYVLDKAGGSAFSFRVSGGIFRENYIKYEIGIAVAGRARPIKRTLTLFGAWNIEKGRGLSFAAEYEDGKVKSITFGARARLTARGDISLRLRGKRNEDLAVRLNLSHKILKGDGQAFLRLLKSKREAAILVGAGFKW